VTERPRILIIDDDAGCRALLEQTLAEAAFIVHVADDGPKGIELAKSSRPDLILLDVRMPGMNGIEVLHRIRATESTRKIPVVFVAGSPSEVDEVVEALDLDPSDFVTRFVSPKELIARIQWVLRKAR
jgi:DNA-binding response OmpR family regulator